MTDQASGTLAALPGASADHKARRIVDSLTTGTRSRLVEHFKDSDVWAPAVAGDWMTVHALTRRGLVKQLDRGSERAVQITPLGRVVLGLLLALGSSSGIRNHELKLRRARILDLLDAYKRPLTTREIYDYLNADGYHVKFHAVRGSLEAMEHDRQLDRLRKAKAVMAWKRSSSDLKRR